MEHILTVDQFEPKEIAKLFVSADKMKRDLSDGPTRRKLSKLHTDLQICSLFYEPSTRTRVSFESAALKLGLGVVSTENAAEFSSASKGETIEDTIKVLNQYGFAAIVMRHPLTGSVAQAASVSSVPIINAGDGKGEHPTQSLLDLYTIYQEFGRLDNLSVVMGGDLRNGRTVRSLAKILSKYPNNHLSFFVRIPDLKMADDIKQILKKTGTKFSETTDLKKAFADADVVYWTRLQKERLEGNKIDSSGFVIDRSTLKSLPKKAIIMHPLPRVDEISAEVDADNRARYFAQAGNGLYIRMALLELVIRS